MKLSSDQLNFFTKQKLIGITIKPPLKIVPGRYQYMSKTNLDFEMGVFSVASYYVRSDSICQDVCVCVCVHVTFNLELKIIL